VLALGRGPNRNGTSTLLEMARTWIQAALELNVVATKERPLRKSRPASLARGSGSWPDLRNDLAGCERGGRNPTSRKERFEIGAHARVTVYFAALCLGWLQQVRHAAETSGSHHAKLSPELIQTMRAALDEVIPKVPVEQATPGLSRFG